MKGWRNEGWYKVERKKNKFVNAFDYPSPLKILIVVQNFKKRKRLKYLYNGAGGEKIRQHKKAKKAKKYT